MSLIKWISDAIHLFPISAAQLKVFMTYAFAGLYPHLSTNLRGILVGAVSAVYVVVTTVSNRTGVTTSAHNGPVATPKPTETPEAPIVGDGTNV